MKWKAQICLFEEIISTSVARIRQETHVSGVGYVQIRGYGRIPLDTYPVRIRPFFVFQEKKIIRIRLGYSWIRSGYENTLIPHRTLPIPTTYIRRPALSSYFHLLISDLAARLRDCRRRTGERSPSSAAVRRLQLD